MSVDIEIKCFQAAIKWTTVNKNILKPGLFRSKYYYMVNG